MFATSAGPRHRGLWKARAQGVNTDEADLAKFIKNQGRRRGLDGSPPGSQPCYKRSPRRRASSSTIGNSRRCAAAAIRMTGDTISRRGLRYWSSSIGGTSRSMRRTRTGWRTGAVFTVHTAARRRRVSASADGGCYNGRGDHDRCRRPHPSRPLAPRRSGYSSRRPTSPASFVPTASTKHRSAPAAYLHAAEASASTRRGDALFFGPRRSQEQTSATSRRDFVVAHRAQGQTRR